MSHESDRRPTAGGNARRAGYEPPRVELVLSSEDLDREVMTGFNAIFRQPV